MGSIATNQQAEARRVSARLDIVRQELLAPIQSIEGYAELLHEHLQDDDFLEDVGKIEQASIQTRGLVYEMLEAETTEREAEERDAQRSKYKHDLRNSVGAIAGYSEIILEELEDEDDPDADILAYLQHLIGDANRLLEMLESLFQGDDVFGEGAEESLNVDIHSIFDAFEKAETEGIERITGDVLVVDDNESVRNILSHKLKRQGHQVRVGTSGREALELIREQVPDVVLLDLFMYDMNGFEVLKELHQDEELRSVPVIVITGLNDKNAAVRCIEAGAFDILTKPINPALLDARVTACLEKKAWRDKEQAYQRELEKSFAFIRKVFGRYMSDEVVKEILEADEGLALGGAKKQVTIMMTDIRGFSMLSQELDAVDSVQLLNNYFGIMTPTIQKYDGVINEFLGDAILAIFGAPVERKDHAQQAMACALEMQNGMNAVNQRNREMGLPEIEMGIALNTGEVVVGNIGSESRQKYGVVGHHVNLTARIESFTIGRQVMVSQYTVDAIDAELEIEQTLEVEAKGIRHPVKIHEIVAIGEPYNVQLQRTEAKLHALEKPLGLRMSTLSGKAVADEIIEAEIIAAGGRAALIRTGAELERLTNLRMVIPEFPPSLDEQLFAKVIKNQGENEGQKTYRIQITSAAQAARKFIHSKIAKEEA
ncbi:MAG: adenylate/guanylate cyclase domain-containing protein [Xanthomonadales bacterium]|nr:adenylate/guanylate cyclase domain-containing protein [Xanthomonadales bacterium]